MDPTPLTPSSDHISPSGRNILCFPIKEDEEVIGVAELCNKTTGLHFTRFDEEIATAFSIYCGISISNSLLYKKVFDTQVRSKLSNELMMFHMKVRDAVTGPGFCVIVKHVMCSSIQ